MSTKSRKRSKGEEERRLTLLGPLLNKFCYIKMNYGHEDIYYYAYHRLVDNNSTSKIEQVILSGNLLFDGLYIISNYDVDRVWDDRQKKFIVEMYINRYDLYAGKDGNKIITETTKELMDYLVGAKYLTEPEFWFYSETNQKPEGMDEVRMIFDTNKKKKKKGAK